MSNQSCAKTHGCHHVEVLETAARTGQGRHEITKPTYDRAEASKIGLFKVGNHSHDVSEDYAEVYMIISVSIHAYFSSH